MNDPFDTLAERRRVVLIAASDDQPEQTGPRQGKANRLAASLRACGEAVDVVCSESYLAGVIEAARPGVRAVVADLDIGPRRIEAALAGLRQAAGRDVPIVLCCRPHAEPLARRMMGLDADDYVIDPPTSEDLDAILGGPTSVDATTPPVQTPRVSTDDDQAIASLTEALARLGGTLGDLLKRLAAMVRQGLQVEGVELSAFGLTVKEGNPVTSPHVTEPLTIEGQQVGQIVLGPPMHVRDEASATGRLRGFAHLFSQILAAHRRESEARKRAMTDAVSGLHNRWYLTELLDQLVQRATSQRFRITLLMFDIDNFKQYNDEYGHTAGDEIIREVGQLMKRCCRKHDVVARYGGDEFAVVFWDADQPRVAGSQHPTDPLSIIDRFRDALLNHRFAGLGRHARGRLTISGGLATFPWEATDAASLVAGADAALLTAKRQGKNRVLPIGSGWLGERLAPAAQANEVRAYQAGATAEEV
ncbi:MAG: GGDEF domain-containing protein [Phycisphaerae bacterium]|nr:GGDEF domain-containing protein [Phycisphaerae bacterium]